MRQLLSKLSLTAGLMISSILLMVILFSALFVALDAGQRAALVEQAQKQQDTGLRVLTNVFSQQFDDIAVRYDSTGRVSKIIWDDIPSFETHTLIDTVGAVSGETATLFLWDETEDDFVRRTTTIIKPDGARAVGTVLGQNSPVRSFMLNKETFRGEADILGKPYLTIYQPLLNSAGDVVGILYVGVERTVIDATIAESRQRYGLLGLGIILFGSVALAMTISRLLEPLAVIAAKIKDVADGSFTDKTPYTDRNDRIGAIAKSVDVFQVSLQEKSKLEAGQRQKDLEQKDVVETLSEGLAVLSQRDLTARIDRPFPADYEKLRADFNETANVLRAAMNDVIASATQIGTGAMGIGDASDKLSQRTENQAATLEETAAALDQLTASVRSSADGAKSVAEIVMKTRTEAEESAEVVGKAINAMTEIETSSDQIGQIIGVIDDIAFQTNLLALNAGVEAARAGEAGRGFAVVASEVRALAQRSTEAAKEIKTLISDSSTQVERGVKLVASTGEVLDKIAQRVTHISELVETMATGTSEQAIGLSEINIGVNQLDKVTQQNAAMVEEANGSSQTLKHEAACLQDLVRGFKTVAGQQSDFDTGGQLALRSA